MNYLKSSLCLSIMLVSMVGWASNSWMTLWMLMEVNLVLFMGLLVMNLSYSVVEFMIKYFIIQSMSSLVMLGCLIMNLFSESGSLNWFTVLVMLIKLGLAPFHLWMISILGKISWMGFFFLSTFLKLIPLLMLSYSSETGWIGTLVGLSAVIGSWGGINESQVQKLLGYSSMVSVAWLLYSSLGGFFFFFFFWLGYFLSLGLFCGLALSMNIFYLNQFKFVASNLEVKITCVLLAFSLSGIPPFLGFLMKWGLTYFLIFLGVSSYVWLMLLVSLFSTFYYLQLWFYILLLFSLELKWYSFNLDWLVWMILLIISMFLILLFYFLI